MHTDQEAIQNFMIILLLLIFLIWIGRRIIQHFLKTQFLKDFGLNFLPSNMSISKRMTPVKENNFELKFPFWVYEKKDGTADLRRKNNYVVWPKSMLFLGKYKIVCKNPLEIYGLICTLREMDVHILKCKKEKEKYARLSTEIEEFSELCSIQNIIGLFRERPTDFEKYCAKIFEKMGYQVKITRVVNDGGYDLILKKEKEQSIVECKCYSIENKIGRPFIQKLVGANQKVGANRMIFITTSDYTKSAIGYADEIGVELINGRRLLELAKKYLNYSQAENTINDNQWWLTKEEILEEYPRDIL